MDGIGIPRRMRGRAGRYSALVGAGAATILTLTAAAPPAAPAPPAGGVTNVLGNLYGVTAVSATDAWAVGEDGANRNLILHWNGKSWAKAAVPRTGSGNPDAVSATSADDVWAVGGYYKNGSDKTQVLHWNGTRWTQVASPSPGKTPVSDQLYAVSAVSPGDAWAVGTYGTPGTVLALALHWNGSRWTRTPLPRLPAQASELLGVDALSADDVWAVGDYFTKNFTDKTLVLHWNGTRWSVLPSPDPAPDDGGPLYAVTAVSATDAWAVGTEAAQRSLVLHWNGTKWSRVASPSPGGTGTASFTKLYSVTALSAGNAWAVGWYGKYKAKTEVGQTLVLHWNGTRWTQVPSPSVGKESMLWSVTALSGSRAWAAGSVFGRFGIGSTLILHWNGKSWTRT